nr:MAG: putative maturation protein [Leviviridae sp.]
MRDEYHVYPYNCRRGSPDTNYSARVLTDVCPTLASWSGFELSLNSPSSLNLWNRMNPSKPRVDLPLFLFELKDLKGMFKEVASFGKSLPNAVRLIQNGLTEIVQGRSRPDPYLTGLAGLNLSLSMGWAPLVSDLSKLVDFSIAFERRYKQLQALAEGKRIRRKVKIDTNSKDTLEYNVRLHGYGTVVSGYGNRTLHVESKRWATSRWAYRPEVLKKASPPRGIDAWRSLLGLESFSIGTLYNAIPFSFLVDYFANIGEILESCKNVGTFDMSHMCVMTQHEATVTYTRTRWDPVSYSGYGGDGTWKRIQKSRVPVSGVSFQPAFQPILSERQLSVLASLTIARRETWRN